MTNNSTACFTPDELETHARILWEVHMAQFDISTNNTASITWGALTDAIKAPWIEAARMALCHGQ